ncbi:helicase [Deltaproteobacteria bacterium PRO3]|nr:helicase [Deltaproteobacteria bacterium PRO3]
MEYQEFLESKTHKGAGFGFTDADLPSQMFDFQKALTEWAVKKGRAAIFADCGLGKSLIQLAWGDNIARTTGRPVLLLTPLAVSSQTIREGEKFGIEAVRSQDGSVKGRIVVTNYERLEKFSPSEFSGVICDESSILKSFDGARRQEITDFMRKVPYRLLATATAAPNDYIELGTSSEALGYLGHIDMLNRFFKNDNNNTSLKRHFGEAPKWRFKGHAETPFWRWVVSWARACRKPSDLGFDDGRFKLPELIEREHIVGATRPPEGMLFNMPAVTLREQREEKKRTIRERCEKAAALASGKDQVLVWCQLNEEGDLLEEIIPGAVQVSGSDSDEAKEERFLGFADGKIRVLVTKPKIGAWGLNFQRCAHVVSFPSHSYEQYYQGIRRCWRFGQERPVVVDLVLTEGEKRVMQNLRRKAMAADKMFSNLVQEMNESLAIKIKERFPKTEEVPSWL